MEKRYSEMPLATRIMRFFNLRSAKTWIWIFFEHTRDWKIEHYEIIAGFATGRNWLSMAPAIWTLWIF
jgi:hypothetical protein